MNNAAILARNAAHDSGLFSPEIALVRGDGVNVYDAEDRHYYDCMAGIAVASLGHAHPALVRAIQEQAARLIVCPQSLGNDARAAFTDALFQLLPSPLARVFLTNSGTEANEAALKWARAATGRSRFVAFKRGFSGRTMGSLPLTWEPRFREPFAPYATAVEFVRFNDADALAAAVTEETAAVLIEPIQGEGGVHEADDEFMQSVRTVTQQRGALLICDEIQTGVGRTGSFLASERSGVTPDMVTLAKGLGGGVPIGALVMTAEVAAAMPAGGHGSTFGGNPLSTAAATAVLKELRDTDLMQQVQLVGSHFMQRLRQLDSPVVRTVRGRGLMIGMELRVRAAPVLRELRRHGVLAVNAGATVIRFLPPLTITREEVDAVVDRVEVALLAFEAASTANG